jgi:hypothetical protein
MKVCVVLGTGLDVLEKIIITLPSGNWAPNI